MGTRQTNPHIPEPNGDGYSTDQHEDRPLDYATRLGPYVSPPRHSALALCLIGVTAIAGIWSIILGMFYLGDWPSCAGLLIGGGGLLCCATIGKLSASKLRLRSALLTLRLAVGLELGATVAANRQYQLRVARYGYQFNSHAQFRDSATAGERAVAPYEMLRNAGLASSTLGALVWVFVGIKVISGSPRRDPTQGH